VPPTYPAVGILTHQGGLYHEPSAVVLELDVVRKDTGESSAPTQTGVTSAKDESAGWIEEDTDVAERAAQEVAIESTAPSTHDDELMDSSGADSTAGSRSENSKTANDIESQAKLSAGTSHAADQASPTDINPPDNLQVIDGIGPGVESRLQEYGVRRFEDLAALDADSAVKLGTNLELEEPEVVLQWVQNAKELNA